MVSPPPQIIISEAHLPLAEKTIKPVAVGGIAGGEKYVSQGILFKVHCHIGNIGSCNSLRSGDQFALDQPLSVDKSSWMYGGAMPVR